MGFLIFLGLVSPDDPVHNCKVYKTVGCAHVDGMLCNMKTCDVEVTIRITPHQRQEADRKGRYEEGGRQC